LTQHPPATIARIVISGRYRAASVGLLNGVNNIPAINDIVIKRDSMIFMGYFFTIINVSINLSGVLVGLRLTQGSTVSFVQDAMSIVMAIAAVIACGFIMQSF
jgi:hypothetical protein